MADVRGANLEGKHVVLRADIFQAHAGGAEKPLSERVVKCTGGFGCQPEGTGKVFITFVHDGDKGYVYRNAVERFATDEEVAEAGGGTRDMIVTAFLPIKIVIHDATSVVEGEERAKKVPLTEWTQPDDTHFASRLRVSDYSEEAFTWWPMLMD